MRGEGNGVMTFARKQIAPREKAPSLPRQQSCIYVGRDVVENASRLTSETLDQISNEIMLEILTELEKKQK
jgi:hypothetical protein